MLGLTTPGYMDTLGYILQLVHVRGTHTRETRIS